MYQFEVKGVVISNLKESYNFTTFNNNILDYHLEAAEGKPLLIDFRCVGGDVNVGFEFYTKIRRYAKENSVKIHTRITGSCDSIATVMFLSGDIREMNSYQSPFFHRPALGQGVGAVNGGDIERIDGVLKGIQGRIAQFYSDHTNLSLEDSHNMMNDETSLTQEEAFVIGFINKKEELLRPVALNKYINKFSNANIMSEENKVNKESFKSKVTNIVNEIMGNVKNQKVVKTATGKDIVFEGLAEDDKIKQGDKALLEGRVVSEAVTTQSGEVITFDESSRVLKVEKKEAEKAVETPAVDNLKVAEIVAEALGNQLKASNLRISGLEAKIEGLSKTTSKVEIQQVVNKNDVNDATPNKELNVSNVREMMNKKQ